MKAEIGTPAGSCHRGEMQGACDAGTVYREFGCAAAPFADKALRPCQSIRPAGTAPSMPSHQGSRDAVIAVLVKSELRFSAVITFGLLCALVPGATPKKPASGLTACRYPSAPICIHAMSSPIVQTRYPLL